MIDRIHHAIIVTSDTHDMLNRAYIKAQEIFGRDKISYIIDSCYGGYRSFFVAPDGAEDGHKTSDIFDKLREEFIFYLQNLGNEEGCSSNRWVEVQY